MLNTLLLFIAFLVAAPCAVAQRQLEVNVKRLGAPVQPTMWGIFFEDINFGADGGLYAELVENRSFEFPQQHFMGWEVFGSVELRDDRPAFARNPHYVRLRPAGHREKRTGLDNHGFFGIGLRQGMQYRFSVFARGQGTLRVELVGSDHAVVDKQRLAVDNARWQKYELTLTATKTDAKAFLRIFHTSGDAIDLDHVSLFPADNWHGLRADLVQMLRNLHPGVFRFPGGCIVEGTQLASRYQWKHSVGPAENRPLNENRWNYTFAHRMFPNYYQTYGLGFYELFLLSEHIGAEPLPILNVGMACQYQNEEAGVPLDSLGQYIQDALDLIEFANGDTATTWGRLRAEMGHAEPFGLKFIGIGNEQWGDEYALRLEPFVRAIRSKHPDIQIVGSAGPSPDDSDDRLFSQNWQRMRQLNIDLVDEHYYRDQQWFLAQASRYDDYPRRGPRVFAGEYACHVAKTPLLSPAGGAPQSGNAASSERRRMPTGMNTLEAALCEAALMTGLERNADVVGMCTYAPLLAHVEGWQWRPDLIWMDNLTAMATPNYYVQQLFARNAGTHVLPISERRKDSAGRHQRREPVSGQDSLYASAVYDDLARAYIIKVVNVAATPQDIVVSLKGCGQLASCEATLLHDDDPTAINTLDRPDAVRPTAYAVKPIGNALSMRVPPLSLLVVKCLPR